MAKRISDYEEPEPGSARWKSRERMRALWADPEYRERVRQRLIENWKDPAYRALNVASQGKPVPLVFLPYLAVHYERAAKRLATKIRKMQEQMAIFEYQAQVCRDGGDPKMVDKVVRNKNSANRYKGPAGDNGPVDSMGDKGPVDSMGDKGPKCQNTP